MNIWQLYAQLKLAELRWSAYVVAATCIIVLLVNIIKVFLNPRKWK